MARCQETGILHFIVDRLRTVPGVENAAITYSLPILGSNWWNVFMIEGTTEAQWISVGLFPNAGMVPVTAGYFETLRIPLVQGRYFERSDRPESVPVAIITRSLAKKDRPNDDAVGKQIRQGFPKIGTTMAHDRWRRGRPQARRGRPGHTLSGLHADCPAAAHNLIRDRAHARSSLRIIARVALHDLDRSIPVFNDRTLEQVMREAASRCRIAMLVLSVFGAVAVLLAAIGLYGVIAQSVTERRQEIGVRMALGASPRQILRLFLQHGLAVVAVGVGCGIVGSLAAARSLASLVFGVTVTDPTTLGGVSASYSRSRCSRATCRRDPRRGSIRWRRCGRSKALTFVSRAEHPASGSDSSRKS